MHSPPIRDRLQPASPACWASARQVANEVSALRPALFVSRLHSLLVTHLSEPWPQKQRDRLRFLLAIWRLQPPPRALVRAPEFRHHLLPAPLPPLRRMLSPR